MNSSWTLIAFALSIFFTTCIASSLDLCPLDLNGTVTSSSNITWAQTVDQPIREFYGPSYLRPDIGTSFYVPLSCDTSVSMMLMGPCRRRIGPVGLQHRHPSSPYTSRHHPCRQVGGRANMVSWCHRLHHRHHSPSLRIHEISLRQDSHLDATSPRHRRRQYGASTFPHC